MTSAGGRKGMGGVVCGCGGRVDAAGALARLLQSTVVSMAAKIEARRERKRERSEYADRRRNRGAIVTASL